MPSVLVGGGHPAGRLARKQAVDCHVGWSTTADGDGTTTPLARWALTIASAFTLLLAACGVSETDPSDRSAAPESAQESPPTPVSAPTPTPTPAPTPATILPAPTVDGASFLSVESSWNWQLQGTVDTTVDADVYDIDLFESPPELIDDLHSSGRVVVCYFSAGSYEGWRPDANQFGDEDVGDTLDGFEDERWLDIRQSSVRSVVEGRLDRAADLGCDGVEPDNVDGYLNETGFDLSDTDQLAFNRFIADAAHERHLLVGLKNDLDQIPDLVTFFDFAVNEQCHEFDECELNQPFIDAGKPVFNAEYASEFADDPTLVCVESRALGLRTLILPLDLDGSFRLSCDTEQ